MDGRAGMWRLAGLVAGLTGLATSYTAAMVLTIRESPVVAIAEAVIRLTPGPVADFVIRFFGASNKALLLVMIFLIVSLVFAALGTAARTRWWAPLAGYSVLALLTAAAVLLQRGSGPVDLLPVVIGYLTWLLVLALLVTPLRRAERAARAPARPAVPNDVPPAGSPAAAQGRRAFLVRALLVGGAAVVVAGAGKVLGSGRRAVEETRRLLRIEGAGQTPPPRGSSLGVDDIASWQTPNDEFYLIHTALVVPAIAPVDWRLRIHGLVEREIELTYDDLLARERTEAWVTLNCVSNPVGGDLVGNALWTGVLTSELLAEAGVLPGADAVLQTSEDGWTCGTPLEALTDDRGAMLAVAMNGEALPIEHGFPVRTLVPGLYGYVSATKWVVDLEVTRFADFSAYWTQRGWGERGPVKIASRIDVPRSGESVPAGNVAFGGVAWMQGTGISAVEFSVDGGPWVPADLGRVPSADTWVQWAGTTEVAPGDHLVRVRATDSAGNVQTDVERDVLPDGATGLDEVDFTTTDTTDAAVG
ncbi:molybdopterin-dependent oxidoreductase [Nocardioides sp. OK12]|uniref:molybdopterin-dependent oxidoreductase n=1 Tax=Nocardioides sp. OK12 TaxID=2758661 RepID=UPI0021C2D3B4|nr:molybdopterin-dependent oxidoreductase [Nocardioides sp. OK12]